MNNFKSSFMFYFMCIFSRKLVTIGVWSVCFCENDLLCLSSTKSDFVLHHVAQFTKPNALFDFF